MCNYFNCTNDQQQKLSDVFVFKVYNWDGNTARGLTKLLVTNPPLGRNDLPVPIREGVLIWTIPPPATSKLSVIVLLAIQFRIKTALLGRKIL